MPLRASRDQVKLRKIMDVMRDGCSDGAVGAYHSRRGPPFNKKRGVTAAF